MLKSRFGTSINPWSGIHPHDLIRLGLSLASAARGSALPGVTTAKMLEELMAGYEAAFEHELQEGKTQAPPRPIKKITRQALHASENLRGEPVEGHCPSDLHKLGRDRRLAFRTYSLPVSDAAQARRLADPTRDGAQS
jgi:uncharacterized protein (DUF2252 family)